VGEDAEVARLEFKALCQLGNPAVAAIGKTEDIDAVAPAGPIPLRIYTPVAAGGAALPAILFFTAGASSSATSIAMTDSAARSPMKAAAA